MQLVRINLHVALWNALKFALLQIIIPVLFANSWTAFVRRRTARILSTGQKVTLISTNLGRLTPASLVHRRHGTGLTSSPITVRSFVFIVNLLLLASVLLTEYGSSSDNRLETQSLLVANRHTINKFQQETNSRIINTLKVPDFLLQDDLSQSALEALERLSNSSAGISTYVLHEHLYSAKRGLRLDSNPKNDLELHEVCGIDPIQPLSPCARMLECKLALPSKKSALLFTVTRLYQLDFPEIHNSLLDDTFVDVQLTAVWPGVTVKDEPTGERIDARDRNVTGVCAGQLKELTSDINSEIMGFLRHCVLSDGAGGRIVLMQGHEFHVPDELKALLTTNVQGIDWSKEGGVAMLPGAAENAITFQARVPPLLALLALMRVVDVRDALRMFDKLPFGADLRRNLMLRALALVGPYALERRVRVRLDSTVAAVNELFFAGLAALLTLVATLACAAAYSGSLDPGIDQPPTDVHEALRMLKRQKCHCTVDRCSICFESQLPIFIKDGSEAKIECCLVDNICSKMSVVLQDHGEEEDFDNESLFD